MSAGRVVVQQIKELGARNDVKVRPLVRVRASAELEIVKQAAAGRHDLMVVGVKARGGKQKLFFGRRISVLLEKSQCSILLVNS
jgi:nucleotide-binding universal stress UspA family protein